MARVDNGDGRIRFGQFEADLLQGKLLKRGILVRLENRPFQVLVALLESPGNLVTREELQSRLWPAGTYVDFDEGLNTAVRKLRAALGDSPESPVFVETVPRRGYVFVAPVEYPPSTHVVPSDRLPESNNGHRIQALPVPVESPSAPIPPKMRKQLIATVASVFVIALRPPACYGSFGIARQQRRSRSSRA